ncbi:hypothetical protein [Mycobacterium xenopi]|uniref:hypothetical protein n=1 Tax=Mycobacterium xenopi TaxID=1789 RepID=UPI0022EB6FD9|nr:hypothetical protein [Mycobacterium xenopi]MDA3657686.1 hypothetical protein [Mycobacterium xenopi]
MPGRPRYSPARPGPVAHSLARYITERYDIEISPAQAQALFSYNNEWQRWRNQPGGEAEQEKYARDAHRSTTNATHAAEAADKPTRRQVRPGANGRNADPAFLRATLARVREPHVAPLNQLADEIADAKGLPRGHVPYVDPVCSGVHARALVLLENPSTRTAAGTGSGLLSLDNDDRTARNLREAYDRHHIDWSQIVGRERRTLLASSIPTVAPPALNAARAPRGCASLSAVART